MKKVSRRQTTLLSTALTLAVTGSSFSAVNFNFEYTDATGVGFNATGQEGEARRNALEQAANYISSYLTAYSADIHISVNGSVTGTDTLASAGSANTTTYGGGDVGFLSQGDVMRKILGGNGADPSPGIADGTVDWNFNFGWFTGDTPEAGKLDFVSTAIHELTHAIGFSSSISQSGEDEFETPAGSPGLWTSFDSFVAYNGTALIDSSFILNGTQWGNASVGGTGAAGLEFIGPNAMAANGGNPVYLYSPTAWVGGSSGSHLDTDFYTPTNGEIENMMNSNSTFGEGELDIREYTDLEIAILRDIGYTQFGLIPEPSTVLLGVFGTASMMLRRRRNA